MCDLTVVPDGVIATEWHFRSTDAENGHPHRMAASRAPTLTRGVPLTARMRSPSLSSVFALEPATQTLTAIATSDCSVRLN